MSENGCLKIHLRANDRIFINGAAVRVDRKVTIELHSDAAFLLEAYILEKDETTTPLRQLYFVVQAMLIEPQSIALTRQIYEHSIAGLIAALQDQVIREGLVEVRALVAASKPFEALRRLRSMFVLEDGSAASAAPPVEAGSIMGAPALRVLSDKTT